MHMPMSGARIRAALGTIRVAYPKTLHPTKHGTSPHTAVITSSGPISAATLDVRIQAHERLAYWSGLITTERKLTHLPAATVPSLISFLTIHADYLATHKWGLKALDELENSADRLTEIATDSIPERFTVGPCPVVSCPGILHATLRRSDDLLPSELACSAENPHVWSSGEWRVLERRMHMNERAARRLMSAINSAP
jgi:hypothetical protein